jgi:hypothetical protein
MDSPWQAVREGVEVKLLPQDRELHVLAQSRARIHKERAMRRRKLKWLWARLKEIAAMELDREELLMKLGAASMSRRPPRCHLQHRARSRQAAPGAAARRALSATHQSVRQRPGRAVAVLHSARRD